MISAVRECGPDGAKCFVNVFAVGAVGQDAQREGELVIEAGAGEEHPAAVVDLAEQRAVGVVTAAAESEDHRGELGRVRDVERWFGCEDR